MTKAFGTVNYTGKEGQPFHIDQDEGNQSFVLDDLEITHTHEADGLVTVRFKGIRRSVDLGEAKDLSIDSNYVVVEISHMAMPEKF